MCKLIKELPVFVVCICCALFGVVVGTCMIVFVGGHLGQALPFVCAFLFGKLIINK